MEKDFECWSCGHKFKADDSNIVECPKCNSDNVEYASFHLPRWTRWIVPVVSVALVIGWGVSFVMSHLQQQEVVETDETNSVRQAEIDSTYINETGLDIPPTVRVVGDIMPDDEGLYSFEAVADNAPTTKYVFTLVDHMTKKEIARSEDGKFMGIPYSNYSEHSYWIQIVDARTDSLLSTPLDISGFVKIEKVDRKMTPQELQTLLLKHDDSLLGVGENKYLSPVCKLHFEGLPKGEINIPEDLAGVLTKLEFGSWKSATVKSLEYDETKHINSITFSIIVTRIASDDEWE